MEKELASEKEESAAKKESYSRSQPPSHAESSPTKTWIFHLLSASGQKDPRIENEHLPG